MDGTRIAGWKENPSANTAQSSPTQVRGVRHPSLCAATSESKLLQRQVLSRQGKPPLSAALTLHPHSRWLSNLLIILFSLLRELGKSPSQTTALQRQKAVFGIKKLINYCAILRTKSTFAQNSVYFSQMPCLLYFLSYFSQLGFVSFFHCYKCSFIPFHIKACFTQSGVWAVTLLRQEGPQGHISNCSGFSKSF